MESKNDVKKTRALQTQRAIRNAALASLFLVAIKGVAFVMSGSLMVLASMFDSAGDVVVSYFNGVVARAARKSPDEQHPFGHGGFEVISSLVQGTFLSILGVGLVIEGIRRLMGVGGDNTHLYQEGLPFAIGTMFFSGISGWLISRLYSAAERRAGAGERSLAAESDHAHYASDAIANGLSGAGLLVVYFTGKMQLDAVFGIVGSVFLVGAGAKVLKHCIRDILDTQVDHEIQKQIVQIARDTSKEIQSIHRLRTRELGPNLFVDFHMTLPKEMPLEVAHALGERAAARIRAQIPRADVLIHLDPDSEPPDDLWESKL